MISTQRETIQSIHVHQESSVLCPMCGARMARIESADGRNREFEWYECIQQTCPGWLVRSPDLVPEFSA
jgi:hypothetical protein